MRLRVWIALVLGVTFVVAGCSRQETLPTPAASPIAVGDQAPGFTLKSAGGGTVSLSDYAGKPVLLYFSMGPG
jgi:cytochrome oxidase Cu insertion factor (SCO1/SenC/PrrC family)